MCNTHINKLQQRFRLILSQITCYYLAKQGCRQIGRKMVNSFNGRNANFLITRKEEHFGLWYSDDLRHL